MDKHTDHLILRAMRIFGGSFVQALANAAERADAQNYAKLREAFPELWNQYGDPAYTAAVERSEGA